MPSVVTHVLTGLVPAKAFYPGQQQERFWWLTVSLPLLPDLDVLGFRFGVEYGDFFGHRGFFHSVFFAALLAVAAMLVFYRNQRPFTRHWWGLFVFFFAITAGHGVLDAMTDGGLGIALLSPFDATRYFLPWTPIMVAPIGAAAFFSRWGVEVLISEAIWVWLPLGVLYATAWGVRGITRKRSSETEPSRHPQGG